MKRYLSDLIGDKFENWGKRKIFIAAPTGIGKTTFIVDQLFPWLMKKYKNADRKFLILCNRKLLRQQYWNDIIGKFDTYADLEKNVEIKTYQELAQELMSNGKISFYGYSAICCDECHYFYADSDFNGSGTYMLLQAMIEAGMLYPMIFMTATPDKIIKKIGHILSIIYETKKFKGENLEGESDAEYLKRFALECPKECAEFVPYDYMHLADYSRFHCVCVPDEETLCDTLAFAEGKSIIFVDSKKSAERMKERMVKKGGVKEGEIKLLNSQNLDESENDEMIERLVMCHKVSPKILITTSVLDNGVSIKDPEVENAAIITESKISFIQMLGRIRSGYSKEIKLYWVKREAILFKNRVKRYQIVQDAYKEILNTLEFDAGSSSCKGFYKIVSAAWEDVEGEKAKAYRQALIACPTEVARINYYPETSLIGESPKKDLCVRVYRIPGKWADVRMVFNSFGMEKTEDMLLIEQQLFSLAIDDPMKVIYEQMSPEQLEIRNSTMEEQMWSELREKLLGVRNWTNEALQSLKTEVAKRYRKMILSEYLSKDGSFSKDKLEQICKACGLKLVCSTDENQKVRYTIIEDFEPEEEGVEEHAVDGQGTAGTVTYRQGQGICADARESVSIH